jgi:hypothetical protein
LPLPNVQLSYTVWAVSLVVWVLLVVFILFVLCMPTAKRRQLWEEFWEESDQYMRERFGPEWVAVFTHGLGIIVGSSLLGCIFLMLGYWLDWPDARKFGWTGIVFGVLCVIPFVQSLQSKAKALLNQRVAEVIFGPRTLMMKTAIGAINNYGGNVAAGNSGPVYQQAHVDEMALHQQLNTFTEKVKTETRYDAARKREAVAELKTLSEQVTLPSAQREESKVKTALKLLPGLLSSANDLAQVWDKLEPWVRWHFGG